MASSGSSKSRSRLPARRALFCSTSRPPDCRRAERRDLVVILNALPKHIGYIIIEHDLDVALRVTEYVSMLHNGRLFKEGTPEQIEDDREVQEVYLEGAMAERSGQPALEIEDLQVYYGESHAIQGVSMVLDHGVLAVVGRNGMGKSTLCNTVAGLKSSRSGSIRILGRETSRPGAARHPPARRRLCPAGRRVWPSLSVDEHLRLVATGGPDAAWTVDRVYQIVSATLRAADQRRLAIVRRRATDAGDLARAAWQSAPLDHG